MVKRSIKMLMVLYLISRLGHAAAAEKTISQQTRGDCSPAIIAQGNVSVNCEISKKLLKRLQGEVNQYEKEQATKDAKQDVKLKSQEARLEALIKDYQELKEILSKRDDTIAKQAQENWIMVISKMQKLYLRNLFNYILRARSNKNKLKQLTLML